MPTPTRFTSGISTARKTDPFGSLGVPDPAKYISYFSDFTGDCHFPIASTGLATASANSPWTLTVTEAGAGNAAAAYATAGPGGAITITNDAADNDLVNAQTKAIQWLPTAGKKAWFRTRFKISDATQSDFLIGMAITDTSLLGSTGGDGVTDGVFFAKDDGATGVYFSVQKNTTTGQVQATGIHTVVADTYVELAFHYDGAGGMQYFVNGVHKGTLDASSTYLPDDSNGLAVSFSIMNGEAVAKSMTIDYIFFAAER